MNSATTAHMQPGRPLKRRRLLRWTGYVMTAGLALVVVLACAGGIYEGISCIHLLRERSALSITNVALREAKVIANALSRVSWMPGGLFE